MNHKFCTQCGAKNYYDGVAPVFCCKCGKNMLGEVVEETESSIEVNSLKNGWQVEKQQVRFETIGEAIFKNSSPRAYIKGSRSSPFAGKDVIEETKKSCSKVTESKSID